MAALAPEDFPVQIVDRILFTARGKFLAALGDAELATDITARLNAGEMWRLGVVEPEPETREEDDEREAAGWTLKPC